MSAYPSDLLKRHIVAKHPVQPPDGVMLPAELWNDTRCRKLVGPLFDVIKHGPYKADLCRLYILFRHGGVYTDDDIYLLRHPLLRSIAVIRESPVYKSKNSEVGLFNAYIEVPWKHDKHILKAIQLSKKQLRITANGRNEFALWGPTILHRALKDASNVVVYQEICKPWPSNACGCKVPNMLISHMPCKY